MRTPTVSFARPSDLSVTPRSLLRSILPTCTYRSSRLTWVRLTRHRRRANNVAHIAACGIGSRVSSPDGTLQLRLVHLRATFDALLARLVVELVTRAPTGTLVRAQPAPPARRDVVRGGATRLAGLAGPGPFLVHRA